MAVAAALARGGRRGGGVVAVEPALGVVEVNLFAPEHAGQGLALHAFFVFAGLRRMDGGVEGVGFLVSKGDDLVDVGDGIGESLAAKPQAEDDGLAGGHVDRAVVQASLGAALLGVDG